MNDKEIVRLVKAGDGEAFSLLVGKYHRQLLNFIWRMLGDGRNVEDIGQEVFLSAYKSIGRFDPDRGTPFSAWLFITARNRCISELRKKGKTFTPIPETAEIADTGDSSEQTAIDAERLAALHASLVQLPEPFRETIIRSLSGDSIEEIALGQGVTAGTAKSRLFRGRERLKSLLAGKVRGDGDEGI